MKRRLYFDLFLVFFKIGAFTFGGGYAMIPLIEKEIVSNKKWIEKDDIIDLFAISQSIPGAIAINTSTLVGYKIAGRRGAIFATLGVILPSFVIITSIAMFFMKISDSAVVEAVFVGINAAVIVLILLAAKKMIKAAITDWLTIIILIITVIAILFTTISPIVLIILGSIPGVVIYYKQLRKGDLK